MNEAGPWGKVARQGMGGWGGAGESPGVMGALGLRGWGGGGCMRQETRRKVVNLWVWVSAGEREATRRFGVTIGADSG